MSEKELHQQVTDIIDILKLMLMKQEEQQKHFEYLIKQLTKQLETNTFDIDLIKSYLGKDRLGN